VFTDTPYNVPIAGHASGLGRNKHSDFVMASGEMTPDEFTQFLLTACSNMARHSRDGSIHFICMDWRHIRELAEAGSKVYSELKNICVWVKSNAGMGSFYRSQHELIFVYKHGCAPHLNNVQLGQFGRNRSNVWSYPGAGTPAGGDEERGLLALHPTVKPVTLVADALMDCSSRNALVLDPFAGSGSTIIAAERTGRRARAIEMDPRFVEWPSAAGSVSRVELRFISRPKSLLPRADSMTRRGNGSKNSSASAQYEVGYGKTPTESRFKKGQSGNPKGRPRGSRSLTTLLAQELDEVITIKENGRIRRITKRQAIAKQLMNKVMLGDQRALKVLLDYFLITEEKEDPAAQAARDASFRRMVDFMNEVARMKVAGEMD
jgi:hypothetical protein